MKSRIVSSFNSLQVCVPDSIFSVMFFFLFLCEYLHHLDKFYTHFFRYCSWINTRLSSKLNWMSVGKKNLAIITKLKPICMALRTGIPTDSIQSVFCVPIYLKKIFFFKLSLYFVSFPFYRSPETTCFVSLTLEIFLNICFSLHRLRHHLFTNFFYFTALLQNISLFFFKIRQTNHIRCLFIYKQFHGNNNFRFVWDIFSSLI